LNQGEGVLVTPPTEDDKSPRVNTVNSDILWSALAMLDDKIKNGGEAISFDITSGGPGSIEAMNRLMTAAFQRSEALLELLNRPQFAHYRHREGRWLLIEERVVHVAATAECIEGYGFDPQVFAAKIESAE
jgi:hypothetical protein